MVYSPTSVGTYLTFHIPLPSGSAVTCAILVGPAQTNANRFARNISYKSVVLWSSLVCHFDKNGSYPVKTTASTACSMYFEHLYLSSYTDTYWSTLVMLQVSLKVTELTLNYYSKKKEQGNLQVSSTEIRRTDDNILFIQTSTISIWVIFHFSLNETSFSIIGFEPASFQNWSELFISSKTTHTTCIHFVYKNSFPINTGKLVLSMHA